MGNKVARRAYAIMLMVRPLLAFLFWILLTLPVATAPAYGAPGSGFEGMRVSPIQFEPKAQAARTGELFNLLPLKRDQFLRMTDVRASIERLFATGRYADVQWMRNLIRAA